MTMKEKTVSLTKKIMSTTRRKFSKEFKAKVVLESLKERQACDKAMPEIFEFFLFLVGISNNCFMIFPLEFIIFKVNPFYLACAF